MINIYRYFTIFIVTYIFNFTNIFAQFPLLMEYTRANGSANGNVETVYDIAVDNDKNVITVGYFEKAIDFDFSKTSSNKILAKGGLDGYVMKHDANGVFQWGFSLANTQEDIVTNVVVDQNGDVIVSGYFKGTTMDMDPSANVSNLSGTTGFNTYIIKYNASGQLLWGFVLDNYAYNYIQLATDKDNNIYVGNTLNQAADINKLGTAVNFTPSNVDMLLIKYDANGIHQWHQAFVGTSFNSQIQKITTTKNNEIIIAGGFFESFDFDPSGNNLSKTSNGARDIFISKLDNTGSLLWNHTLGGTAWDEIYDVVEDTSENIHAVGYFKGAVDFSLGGSSDILTPLGYHDSFWMKLNSNGQKMFINQFSSTGEIDVKKITYDSIFNSVVIAASYSDRIDLDFSSNNYFMYANGGSIELALAGYNPNGTFKWADSIDGTAGEFIRALKVNKNGDVILSGSFNGKPRFYPADTAFLVTNGNSGFFATYHAGNGVIKDLKGTVKDNGGADRIFKHIQDAIGNIYAIGNFSGTVNFDLTEGTTSNILSSNGGLDIFIAKYSKDGGLIWVKSWGNIFDDVENDIHLTGDNQLIVSSNFYGKLDFLNNELTAQKNDALIASFDTDGNLNWYKQFGSTMDDKIYSITSNQSNQIFFTASYEANVSIDAQTLTIQGDASSVIYVLNTNGTRLAHQTFTSDEYIYIKNIAFDKKSDELFIAGKFKGNTSIYGSPMNYEATFVSKINSTTYIKEWTNVAFATYATSKDILAFQLDTANNSIYIFKNFQNKTMYAYHTFEKINYNGLQLFEKTYDKKIFFNSIAIDNEAHVYVAGYFTASTDVFTGEGVSNLIPVINNNPNPFFVEYDQDGSLVFQYQMPNTNIAMIQSITVDDLREVYITGTYQDDLYYSSIYNFPAKGYRDIFISKHYRYAGCVEPDVPTVSVKSTNVCSNEKLQLQVTSGKLNSGLRWQWYEGSCQGTPIGTGSELNIDVSSVGTYFVRAEGGCITPINCNEVTFTGFINPPTVSYTGVNYTYESYPNDPCLNEYYYMTAAGADTYEWLENGVVRSSSESLSLWMIDNYSYELIGVAANGCSDTLAVNINYKECSLTSIIENNKNLELSIYPNPTNNGIFQLNQIADKVIVRNVLGQEQLFYATDEITTDFKGMLMLEIFIDDQRSIKNIISQ